MEDWKTKDTEALVKDFLVLLKEKAKLALREKELNKQISAMDCFLANRMMEKGSAEKITIEGIDFQPVDDEQFTLNPDKIEHKIWDNPIFHQWLKDQGLGDLIKVDPKVHGATRIKVLKELRDDNKPLPDYIKIQFFTHMKYNKSKIERMVK